MHRLMLKIHPRVTIRNNLEIDEGDPYNEILQAKSVNNLRGLNFFKEVDASVITGTKPKSKIIDINFVILNLNLKAVSGPGALLRECD